jgi:hypothetical protein
MPFELRERSLVELIPTTCDVMPQILGKLAFLHLSVLDASTTPDIPAVSRAPAQLWELDGRITQSETESPSPVSATKAPSYRLSIAYQCRPACCLWADLD